MPYINKPTTAIIGYLITENGIDGTIGIEVLGACKSSP